jgi:hypothetical protein
VPLRVARDLKFSGSTDVAASDAERSFDDVGIPKAHSASLQDISLFRLPDEVVSESTTFKPHRLAAPRHLSLPFRAMPSTSMAA